MADNLLDKASILLTPTAYDNGSMLSIKPENGDGDFDFERNSAATRVNAQGLVENVQIISSELVSNGNFSQIGTEEVSNGNFSQEGSELVTNGTFENNINGWVGYISDSSWDNGTIKTTATTNVSWIRQNQVTAANKSYKLTFKAKASDISQNITIYNGAFIDTGLSFDAVDVYQEFTYYFYTTVTNIIIGQQGVSVGDTINFDNVSVKEVGQNWELDTGWSIGDDKVEADGTSAFLIQSNFQSVASVKSYKIQYEVLSTNGVNIRFGGGSSMFGTPTLDTATIGIKTIYLQSNGTVRNLQFQNNLGFEGSITNISVKEVGQDWSLDTGWSIDQANSKAVSDGTQGYIKQTNVGGAGVTSIYKAQWTQNITVGARLRFFARNYNDTGTITTLSITRDDGVAVDGGNCVGSGTFTAYLSSTNGYSFKILAETGVEADISNISVKEITDDTNIPRINYEGFSYQDSLGSELITNGNFSNGLTNWTNNSSWWSIVNGEAYHPASTSMKPLSQSVSTEVGKEYKISVNVNIVSGTPQVFWDKVSGQEAQSLSQGLNEVIVTTFKTNSAIYFGRVPSTNTEFYIDNVSVKEYLGQEVVPDSGCGSWLLENQSTNLIPYSEDFSDSSWLKETSATIELNTYLSPSGENNASKLNLPNTLSRITYPFSTTGVYTFSIYLKSDTDGTISLRAATGNPAVTKQLNLTDRWQRFDISVTDGNYWQVIKTSSDTLTSVYIWGAQLEEQSYATSYVPTSGATNTRLKDIANNSGNSSLINSTEGVLYAEIAALAEGGSYRIISLSDNTNNNKVVLFYDFNDNRFSYQVKVSGVSQSSAAINNVSVIQFNKFALKYKDNDFALWINGVEVATDTSGNVFPINTLNKLSFSDGNNSSNFYGKAKAVAVFPILTDAELQSLTTI